jgi:hypothetical protein
VFKWYETMEGLRAVQCRAGAAGEAARLRAVRVRIAAAEEGSWDVTVSADAKALMLARRIGHHGAWSELSRALEVEREDLLEEVGAGVAFGAQEGRGCLRRGSVLGLERHAPVRHAREARKHVSSLQRLDAFFRPISGMRDRASTPINLIYRQSPR